MQGNTRFIFASSDVRRQSTVFYDCGIDTVVGVSQEGPTFRPKSATVWFLFCFCFDEMVTNQEEATEHAGSDFSRPMSRLSSAYAYISVIFTGILEI